MARLISPIANILVSLILSDPRDSHFKDVKVTKMRLYLRYRQIICTFDPPIC